MKIGIVTFWWSDDNYGQLLQIFALQHFLNNNGHNAYLIKWNPFKEKKEYSISKKIEKLFNPLLIYYYFKSKIKIEKIKKNNNMHPRYFDDFRDEYIQSSKCFNSFTEINKESEDTDVFIVGSDQVWNPDCTSYDFVNKSQIIDTYFLGFLPNGKPRIAYAASWGRKDVPKEWENYVSPMLHKFSYVSVREKSGISLCTDCGYPFKNSDSGVAWVCDPTMLVSPEEYRKVYSVNIDKANNSNIVNHSEEKYIVFYYVNNGGNNEIQQIFDFAKSKNLQVRYITANYQDDCYEKTYPSIQQWLELIDHATYVITNSFHCCVFSILFHKQFAVMPINGKYSGMNERIESLFDICGIDDRVIRIDNGYLKFDILDKAYTPNIPKEGGEWLLDALNNIKKINY